jgi:hypothetical protein
MDFSGRAGEYRAMIDLFSLGLTHALLMLIAWRLLQRPDLDDDDAAAVRKPWGGRRDA